MCLFGKAQDRIDYKEIYYENFLAYRYADDHLFSGIAFKARRNGHVVYEDSIVNGHLIKMRVFFNRDPKKISTEYYYYPNSFEIQKEVRYEYKRPYVTHIYYNTNGKRRLEETYLDTVVTYKCEYKNGKKHGIEFCINEDGSKWSKTYENGKRIKKEQ